MAVVTPAMGMGDGKTGTFMMPAAGAFADGAKDMVTSTAIILEISGAQPS